MGEYAIVTDRLILRPWRDRDLWHLHNLCSDMRVMQYLGPPQSEDEVAAMIARQNDLNMRFGYCFWAVELRKTRLMIGLCGLKPGPDGTPLAGHTEIGWRLAFDHWGYGYAREAAAACLEWAWARLDIQVVGAITVHNNLRSRTLMERIGMTRRGALDFDHPNVPDGSPLKRHVTYAIERPAFTQS